jgi:hypothetical protein
MWKKKLNQREEQFVRNNFLRVYLISFSLLLSLLSEGSHFVKFTPNLLVAQKQNLELRLSRASDILEIEQKHAPGNSATYYLHHANVYLKAFVSEESDDYEEYEIVRDAAIAHFELLPDSIAFKKFLLSEVYFYSATLKAKHNELYGAARDVNRAHTLIEENHTEFPDFLPNNKTRGILKVYLSTVPENYAWVIRMLGIRGNLNEGLSLLKKLSSHRSDTGNMGGIARETHYLYAFSLMHVANRQVSAWSEMLKATTDYRTNLVSCFFRSNMALKLNKNESAIGILENRPVSLEYERFYLLEYLLGTAKLNKQDPSAINHLARFHSDFKGINYIKSNLQRMSWYYLINGDLAKANHYKAEIAKKGSTVNEEDKQAQRFVKKQVPNDKLLSTRLFYDGGYFEKAAEVLATIEVKKLATMELKAEYCYRKGRILEKQGKMDIAGKLYEACSLFAINSEEYYGAYASIFLGDYYLGIDDKVSAQKFYKRALSFQKNKEYTNSVEQRAKAGLKKCN